MEAESFLRMPDVMRRVGYSKSRIYALVAQDQFPKPVAIGQRASAWLKSEIDNWIQSRINASRRSA
jgi:prophage regulatory protein